MRRFKPLALVFYVGVLSAPLRGRCEGPPKKPPSRNYKQLVAQLVSPNRKATTDVDFVRFPAGYDVKAQDRIDSVRKVLQDNFEAALPSLINALDDDRYCMTIDWADGDAYYNKSVSDICRDILASQLEVYRDKIRFGGPTHWHRYDYGPISKEWWQKRKNRSLAELQVEAIDWAIKRREAAREKERRKEELAALRKLRDGIARSEKPAKPRGMLRMVVIDKG
ncbi:MAG TPA: hypothetical protein VG406_29465 [Isosphaeraceae bacterium]|jgi:hypothetical protein|nr:hypothetical protein [Isosphaeraceae bacterium]